MQPVPCPGCIVETQSLEQKDLELLPGSTFQIRHFAPRSISFLARKTDLKIHAFHGYGSDEMRLDTQKT